ncbi:acyltransferase domain-containing protein [Melghirimyces algeriensis]|uniref:Bacillaene synthase trans-acting acyltransferase n=1 Tax=Melghirimyces algeriensis TaxID=910412 RepID=A0A521FH45_9BACL|nr:acyltransferase domain-containing protein [Melghirimyces algeriensis]SMO95538.1 bacillaene synthase trans-acting acyltransferase [Melghirimyces algeriensis]
MFSGQGSQYFHMGRELYEQESVFHENMRQLDVVFQKATGKSIIGYMYDEHRLKSDDFSDLFYTHPAIFMIEVALAQMVIEKGIHPDAVMGASLGEYAAGAVAGVFRPEDALEGLIDQVQLLEKFSQPGGMMAILASPSLYDEVPILHHHAQLAAVNNESHFVIAAHQEGLNTVERYLCLKEITYLRLPVTVPFHSTHIEMAGEAIQTRLAQISYQSPRIPFYSSVTGKKQDHLTAAYFWDVLRKPIQFGKALTEAVEHGAVFIDLGPSGTLANVAKAHYRQRTDLSIFHILSPFTDNAKALEGVYNQVAPSR